MLVTCVPHPGCTYQTAVRSKAPRHNQNHQRPTTAGTATHTHDTWGSAKLPTCTPTAVRSPAPRHNHATKERTGITPRKPQLLHVITQMMSVVTIILRIGMLPGSAPLQPTTSNDGERRRTPYRTPTNALNTTPPDKTTMKQRWSGTALPTRSQHKTDNIRNHKNGQRTEEQWSGALLPAWKTDPDDVVEPCSSSMATLRLHNPIHNIRHNKWSTPPAGPTFSVERKTCYRTPCHSVSVWYSPLPTTPRAVS